MRARVIIPISVALNIMLGVMFWKALKFPVMETPTLVEHHPRVSDTSTNTTPKVVVRRQFFNWAEIESDD